MLPAASIDKRWSTFAALAIVEDIETAADSLLPIVRMSKLKLPKRAKHVVLSSGEKYSYAKAMVEPLLQHLSDLSSADFYQELYAWKETMEVGLRQVKSRSANHAARTCDSNNDNDSGDEGDGNTIEEDAFSVLDPAEAMATMYLMNALETATSNSSDELQIKLNDDGVVTKTEVSNSNVDDDDDEVSPTQVTGEKMAYILKRDNDNDENASCQPEPEEAKISAAINKDDDLIKSNQKPNPKVPLARQVDIINVPKPPRRGRARTTLRQLRQTKLTSGPDRVAVQNYPSDLTVSVDQLIEWARCTPNLKHVMELLQKYPVQLEDAYLRVRAITCQWELVRPKDYMHTFVTPLDLAKKLQAAITTARHEQREPGELEDCVKAQGLVLDLVVSIDPKLWRFSGFYSVKRKIRSWLDDRKWLEQDWRSIDSDVDLFASQTHTLALTAEATQARHQVLANEIISKFTSSRLSTEFISPCGKEVINFENIVGGVSKGWMNDSPIDF
ncbi:unnamed protein product [Phytophthora fragariaefolia]|uniref:Unnamed protein product n=1 Tax=Phytophthora fragariaefolia TaxID=1490495 RepID=A0A9W6TYT6_9STRA|nr:unnamed protein product [Phytophthora fragariaefolia]